MMLVTIIVMVVVMAVRQSRLQQSLCRPHPLTLRLGKRWKIQIYCIACGAGWRANFLTQMTRHEQPMIIGRTPLLSRVRVARVARVHVKTRQEVGVRRADSTIEANGLGFVMR